MYIEYYKHDMIYLLQCDLEEFTRMLRMPPSVYEFVLSEIRHAIIKKKPTFEAS